MYELLILFIIIVVTLIGYSLGEIKKGKWFEKAKLGDILVQIEKSKDTDEVISLAEQAEKIKSELAGTDYERTLKSNPYVAGGEDEDTSSLSIGELLTRTTKENREAKNIYNLFDESNK